MIFCCDSQSEADSVKCVNEGQNMGKWNVQDLPERHHMARNKLCVQPTAWAILERSEHVWN